MNRAASRLLPFRTSFFIFLVSAFLAGFCLTASPARAAKKPGDLTMQAEDENAAAKPVTWTLNADTFTSLGASEVIEARGNVVLRHGDEYLKADYARYYQTTKWVFLRGNVHARLGSNDTMSAEEAEFDLRSRVGWLKQGQVFMDGPHMYLTGDRIDKHWGEVYSFKNAKITVCDGDTPAWSVAAAEAVVEIDGYAQLWKPKFQIKDVPLLASPWAMLPAKKDRQTGLLFPEFGKTSKLGTYINIPFFWAIDESRDLTLNEYFMDRRGLMQGVQYRSHPSANEMTWLRFDWLKDKKTVDKEVHDNILRDGYIRPNANRYWVRGMHEGYLGDPRWKVRANIDYVSDQNYLYEFKNGLSGYTQSRETLLDLFRRDLTEKNFNRESGLMLFRDWDRVSVALSALYTQNPNLGHGNAKRSTDGTVQYLPQLEAFLHKGRLLNDLPLEFSAGAQAGYMYRREGTRGMRYVMTPQVSLPLNTRYGSIMATGSLQQTFYGTDTYGNELGANKKPDGKNQTVPSFQIDGSTEVMRSFSLGKELEPTKENLGKEQWTGIRHTLQPRIRYRKTPTVDQSDNPTYDDTDRLRARSELTYSLTNIFTRKRTAIVANKAAEEGGEPTYTPVTSYLDVLRLHLEQSYDFKEAERDDQRDRFSRRPYSDLIGEGTLSFDEFLSISSRIYWSPYKNIFTRQDHSVRFTYDPWGYVSLGYGFRRKARDFQSNDSRYQHSTVKTLNLEGEVDLYGPFSMAFLYKHDYEHKKNNERQLEFIYNHQCFQLIGTYSRDEIESHYRFGFRLFGVGEDTLR